MAASLPAASPQVSSQLVKGGSVLSLPIEIWTQVFEHLCVHCQVPDHAYVIPDFRLADARAGKAALMALCLVSRDFRAISQGILFHYFLNHSKGGDLEDDGFNNDRTPSFLRALILNPPLGRHVRMMGLFTNVYESLMPCKPDIKRQHLEAWTRVSASLHVQVPSAVTRALDGHMLDDEPRLFFGEPGPMAQLRLSYGMADVYEGSNTIEAVFKWLHVLILNFVPHLTHLQLAEPLGSLEEIQNAPPTLLQLRELTYDTYTLENLIESQRYFPNLRSLGVRALSAMDDPRPINCPIPTMNLRKLSIHARPGTISLILRLCPYLEDLECHVDPSESWWSNNHDDYAGVKWPASAKNTLRRLAWSNQDYIEDLDEHPDLISLCTVPLREFKRLAILEIDQLSLLMYSRSVGSKDVSSALPKTLRILHLAFSRDVLSPPEIACQLRAIAGARAVDLPNLDIVKVGDPPRWGAFKNNLVDFLDKTDVERVMEDAGIELRIGEGAPKYSWDRSILSQPHGAGRKNFGMASTFQDEVFSLYDI